MPDFFNGSYIACVCDDRLNELGEKKFKKDELAKAKEWAKAFGRKHSKGKKFHVEIRKDYYTVVHAKYHR